MRFFINPFFIFLIFLTCAAQAQTTFNIKIDFGARGDNITDDTKAFEKAFTRINTLKKNVLLFIPAGNYLVKPQTSTELTNPVAFLPVNIISLINCHNITIKGERGTKIQFASSLYFGSFRKEGNKVKKLENKTTDYQYRIAIGHGIYLENSSNITIQSIEINGNNQNFILGNEFGDVGMQIDNDGVFLANASFVTLSNMNIHHFGRDGIQIINKTPKGFDTPSQNIILSNCKFEYNGRQGLSWTGGVGLVATNCSFSYTGQTKLSSPPGAGVDFEPNAGYVVKNGLFTNCTFSYNSGVGILADEGGFSASGMQFINCTITGKNSPAIWVKSPAFVFTNCSINGSFYFGCAATNAGEGTKFFGCTFSDLNIEGKTNFLVESNGSKYLLFDNCTFKAYTKGLIYIAADAGSVEQRAVLKDCRFISLHKVPPRAGSFTNGVDFTGETKFIDSSTSIIGWNIENSRFTGTKKVKNEISVYSKYSLASYGAVNIGNDIQEVKVNIFKDGALFINTGATLQINKNAKLVIHKGGSLWIAPGATLLVKGKIIAEEGSYLCIHQTAKISQESLTNIEVSKGTRFSDNPAMKYGLSGCINIERNQ